MRYITKAIVLGVIFNIVQLITVTYLNVEHSHIKLTLIISIVYIAINLIRQVQRFNKIKRFKVKHAAFIENLILLVLFSWIIYSYELNAHGIDQYMIIANTIFMSIITIDSLNFTIKAYEY